jgi:2-methylisocitrate lyase-like PEP mutase family enzyme
MTKASPDTANHFHALHRGPRPLVLFNIWDAGSARAVAEAGASALATGSWSVAAAHGLADGEQLTLDLALANLARITTSTSLPVTIDLERGYDDIATTVRRAIDAGAVGCNLEDGLEQGMRDTDEQVHRLSSARAAADATGVPMFINARTDLFLQTPPDAHDAQLVEQAIGRAQAYAGAGASGFFVPGLADPALIETLVRACPLPLNVMVVPGLPPLERLAELGVARVSHGPGPYLATMQALTQAAHAAMD